MKRGRRETFKIHIPAEGCGDPHRWVEGICPGYSTSVVIEIDAVSLRDALSHARLFYRKKIERDKHDQDLARRETKEFP